jgi:hypothetical protein
MKSRRIFKTAAVVGASALILGAFVAGPAQAKKKKPKKPAVCAPYVPGELGTGQPISVVTDAATADKPVEATVATEPGLGFTSPDGASGDEGRPSHVFYNVQVDSAAPGAYLYVREEFQEGTEYDLFLRDATGAALAYAAGANQTPTAVPDPIGLGLDGTGNGGHSEFAAEQIDGYSATDCAGYTVDVGSAITPGGDVTLKFWLGDAPPA